MYAYDVRCAWTEVWSGSYIIAQGRLLLLWVPGVAIWADFEIFKILGGAGDIHNSTRTSNYCDEPYGDLGMYVKKLLSAWTEVSIAT